jgi:phage terminase Nu1 subunit (DNA packaging protein)
LSDLEKLLNQPGTQRDFAALVGISEPAASKLAKRLLAEGQPIGVWLLAYCENLREQAAGRKTDLATERAGLAREQKFIKRIEKLQKLGEWAPIANLTLVLSRVTGQMASVFDGIPGALKRTFPDMTADQLNLIRGELNKARNLLVSVGEQALADADKRLMDYTDEFHGTEQEVEG